MIQFLRDGGLDAKGRAFYEVWRGTERLGYVLLPPFLVEGIENAIDVVMTLHDALHPEEASS